MTHYRASSAVLATLLLAVAGGTNRVAGQGLTVRLAPQASNMRWAPELGLTNGAFYGGGLALGFGRFVSLHGSYRFANALQTSLAQTTYDGGNAEENLLGAALFSTGVEIRIGDRRLAPVIAGTGGVFRVAPQGRENLKQIMVGYGGGLDARIRPWLTGQLMVEDLRFRLDRSTVAGDTQGALVAPDPDRAVSRGSTSVTLSFGARLGGGRASARASALDRDMARLYGGEGLMVRAELTGGLLRFDEGLLLPQRPHFGMRAGFDFGPFFGLRGSYSRGAERDFAGLVGMTAWSGEAQFNLRRATNWSTHLLLGFGQITFDPTFLNEGGTTPDDQNALIVGGGVGIPLGPRTQILFSLRDHITTVGEISGVSTPNDLRHNFGISAGVSFLIHGSPRPVGSGGVVFPAPNNRAAQEEGPELEGRGTPARTPTQPSAVNAPPGPSDRVPTGRAPQAANSEAAAGAGYQSDRSVSIPLPHSRRVLRSVRATAGTGWKWHARHLYTDAGHHTDHCGRRRILG